MAALAVPCLISACSSGGDSAPELLVEAGPEQTVAEGGVVTLTPVVTQNQGTPTYQWVQVSGPAVTLDDPSSASPSFTVGDMTIGQAVDLVFAVTVGDGPGRTAQDTVTVHTHASDAVYYALGGDHELLYVWDPYTNTASVAADPGVTNSVIEFLEDVGHGSVVFATHPNTVGKPVIYQIPGPGQPAVALTAENPDPTDLRSWGTSPDGNYFTYQSTSATAGETGIFLIDLRDGSRTMAWDNGANARQAQGMYWSPDSAALLLATAESGWITYAVHNPATGQTVDLNADPVANGLIGGGDFAFDPTGGAVFFSADDGIPLTQQLFKCNLDGTGRVLLSGTPAAGGSVDVISVSPDGSKVAYTSSELDGGARQLFVVNSDGTGRVRVNPNLEPGHEVTEPFYWSEDGSRVIFIAREAAAPSEWAYSVLADGTDIQIIGSDVIAGGSCRLDYDEVHYNSEGNFLVYMEPLQIGQLLPWLVSADGSVNVSLGDDLTGVGSVYEGFLSRVCPDILFHINLNPGMAIYRLQASNWALQRLDQQLGAEVDLEYIVESPDRSRLVVTRAVDATDSSVQFLSADGTVDIPVEAYVPVNTSTTIEWHPDSKWVAVEWSNVSGRGMYVYDSTSQSVMPIFADAGDQVGLYVWCE
ncbi:MAG: hypothetical protein R3F17_16955 [Planctomycetota bacterium]